jgi:hypothetical protein
MLFYNVILRVQQNFNHMGCSDAIHGWMDGMNGKLHEKKPQHPLLDVIC